MQNEKGGCPWLPLALNSYCSKHTRLSNCFIWEFAGNNYGVGGSKNLVWRAEWNVYFLLQFIFGVLIYTEEVIKDIKTVVSKLPCGVRERNNKPSERNSHCVGLVEKKIPKKDRGNEKREKNI